MTRPRRLTPLALRALRACAPALPARVRIPLLARAFALPAKQVARLIGGAA